MPKMNTSWAHPLTERVFMLGDGWLSCWRWVAKLGRWVAKFGDGWLSWGDGWLSLEMGGYIREIGG